MQSNETALQIIKLETELQQVSEQVKAQIDFYNQTKASIEALKQKLKEETTGKISEDITVGENTLHISIHDSNRVSVDFPERVPKEYTTKTKVDGVYLGSDGEFYTDKPNTTLISNLYKAGGELPDGCSVKTSRSISLKFNGETL